MLKLRVRLEKCTKVFYLTQKPLSTVAEPATRTRSEETETRIKEYENLGKLSKKAHIKKPQRKPFAKSLFLGQFDVEILEYPQLLKEELTNLDKIVNPIKDDIKGNESSSGRGLLNYLGNHNYLGLQVPELLGGKDCKSSEACKVVEAISQHNLCLNMITQEYLGIQPIHKYGTDQQKKMYLPKLMSGDMVASFCLLEPHVTKVNTLGTKAKFIPSDKHWILNGEKIWVLNGNSADVFIVLAESGRTIKKGMDLIQVSTFLVDRNQKGVSTSKNQMGYPNMDMCNVKLENVIVTSENVLGPVNEGTAILQGIIPEFRLNCGIPNMLITKDLLNEFVKFCIDNATQDVTLHELDEVGSIVAEIATNLYAMESIIYLTSGLMDQYENQDCELEAAIVKSFTSEYAYKSTTSCINFIGTSSLLENHWCNRLHQKALQNLVLQEANDNMKIMISLMGLQYAGLGMKETIQKLRNPLFNAGFIFKKMIAQKRQMNDNPKLNLGLESYLHPTLMKTSKNLEYCVKRLEFATELLFSRYGTEVVNQHISLKRLADCIIDIYAMTACLGRSSRSYCIGLRNSEVEITMANVFCHSAMERVKERINNIVTGEILTNDRTLGLISSRTFKYKEYCASHPLDRNF